MPKRKPEPEQTKNPKRLRTPSRRALQERYHFLHGELRGLERAATLNRNSRHRVNVFGDRNPLASDALDAQLDEIRIAFDHAQAELDRVQEDLDALEADPIEIKRRAAHARVEHVFFMDKIK
jgi:hypothetical protein